MRASGRALQAQPGAQRVSPVRGLDGRALRHSSAGFGSLPSTGRLPGEPPRRRPPGEEGEVLPGARTLSSQDSPRSPGDEEPLLRSHLKQMFHVEHRRGKIPLRHLAARRDPVQSR